MSASDAGGSTAWTGRYEAAVMNTFGPPKLVLDRGEGALVWDVDGKVYVDLLAGIAVNSLGHAHPAVLSAMQTQAARLVHVSNFFATRPQVALAERLLDLVGQPGRVFFANSGAEANEAAMKLTRRTGRTRIVAAEGAFHGRTMGALALTSKEAYRAPFEPLPGDVTFVPYGDVAALRAAVDDTTAAVVLEPVQGEAGAIVPPEGYLEAARAVTLEHGALLWLDEVQAGVGRTGRWFGYQHADVQPDVVTLAKGLGGGFPIGACLGLGDAATLLGPGNHGTTFGGNPLATAVALAVLDTIEADGLLARADELGRRVRQQLTHLPHVADVSGRGLLVGVGLDREVAADVVAACLDRGVILNACTPDRLRIVPPLVITDDQVEHALHVLGDVLGGLDRGSHRGGPR